MLCSFQSPVEVPGVSNSDFLRLAANARRKQLGQEELGPLEFYGYVMPKVLQHTFSCTVCSVPCKESSHISYLPWATRRDHICLSFCSRSHCGSSVFA